MSGLATVLLGALFVATVWGVPSACIVRTTQPTQTVTLTLSSLSNGSVITASQENREMPDSNQIISAEVLLRPASGATIDGNAIITSKNIKDYAPAPETVQTVSQFFRDNGFEVTPVVGVSFTISGAIERFCELFNISLTGDRASGFKAVSNSTLSEELPLNSLPNAVADSIVAVTFVPQPDFGPTRFGP